MKLKSLLLYTHCLLATASLLPRDVPAAPPDCRKAAGAQRNAANTACETRPESERYECKRDALRIYRVEIARCPLDPNKDLCVQRAENNAALRTEECYRLEGTALNRCTKEALRLERNEKSQCPAPDTYTVNGAQPRMQTYSCYNVIRRARDVDRRRCDRKNNPGKCRRRQDETYKARLGQCAKKARLEVTRERNCYEQEINIFEAGMANCQQNFSPQGNTPDPEQFVLCSDAAVSHLASRRMSCANISEAEHKENYRKENRK